MHKQITQQPVETRAPLSPDEQMAMEIATATESILFVSGRPLERAELRKLLDIGEESLTQGLQRLEHDLENQGRGIRLQRLGEHGQLGTAPQHARYNAALYGPPLSGQRTSAPMRPPPATANTQPVTP